MEKEKERKKASSISAIILSVKESFKGWEKIDDFVTIVTLYSKKYTAHVENSKEHKNVWLGWGIWERIASLLPSYPWLARFSSLPLPPVASILSLAPPYPFDPPSPVGIYISGGFLSPVAREKTMDRYNRKRTIVGTVSAECRRRMAWQVISDDTKFCDT